MKNFAINGFGRIGRVACRAWYEGHRQELNLTAINTSGSMDLEGWAHLFKYDSAYGKFPGEITWETVSSAKDVTDENPLLGYLILGKSEKIPVLAQRDPNKIPWTKYKVDAVIDSTGVFLTKELASQHLAAGAKKVVISAPPKGDDIGIQVLGVNKATGEIISNASCTTNSVAPVASVIESALGIKKAMLTTVHAYTDDQKLQDGSHKDLRRARAAANNIVPTSTGAAIATTETIPALKGRFDGIAVRVPVITGSLSDMTFLVSRPTSVEEVNGLLVTAAKSKAWQGILAVSDEPLVSSDIVGRSESAIVDLDLTRVIDGDLVKVVAWYDNEWGYAHRLVETVLHLS